MYIIPCFFYSYCEFVANLPEIRTIFPEIKHFWVFGGITLLRIFEYFSILRNRFLLPFLAQMGKNWQYDIDNGSSKESFYNDNVKFKNRQLSLYILYWFVILLVVMTLVAKIARFIDDITFD